MARARPRHPPQPAAPPFGRTHRWLLVAIVAVIFATADDRHVGLVADGRQMIWTAIAIAETGTIGQARARDLTFPRDGGDSVSRFGMGMSFAQVPAAWLAPRVEASFGAAAAQPLFLMAPFLFVMLSAIFAGMAARDLAGPGGTASGSRAAIVLSTVASPLAAYAALELSEPLQAAALAGAYAAALRSARLEGRRARRMAGAAGCAAGVAVLAKSSLLFVAPLALLPLATGAGSRDRLRAAAFGFLPIAGLWLALEIVRFGHPFASYAGEGFTHPFVD